MTTLLAHLAQFASFSLQSEVLCTQGLAYLLQAHEDAREALANELQARTGILINEPLTWRPEALLDDGGRPDLEARTAEDVPVVMIEAKLGAELGDGQLESYVADLQRRNKGDAALLVLVPKVQTAKFIRETASVLQLQGSSPWPVMAGQRVGIDVISWDELFDVLRVGTDERYRYELEQLQAMYRVLSGDNIAPLASIEDLREWRERETDFRIVVDRVTRRLTTKHALYPMGLEPLEQVLDENESNGYRRRYVCPCVGKVESCFSIGVRDSFAESVTPIWMRFRSDTGYFELIRKRIEASLIPNLESGGHIWIPLDVPRDKSGEEMVEILVAAAEKVLQVAYKAEQLGEG